ncbi:hypothetical protein BGX38DRAFT_1279835 [Terfezia claveryi]|nr:hypothetical protein BGX38DRAFT_1279835 [Terfezia claveryi]
MVQVSTDKDILDKVPASTEICFQAIANAGSQVEYEKVREAHAQSQFHQKEQAAGAKKEVPNTPKTTEKKSENLKDRITKPKQRAKTKPNAKSKPKSDTSSKKEKEPGQDKVTYAMRQARKKDGYISKNNICVLCDAAPTPGMQHQCLAVAVVSGTSWDVDHTPGTQHQFLAVALASGTYWDITHTPGMQDQFLAVALTSGTHWDIAPAFVMQALMARYIPTHLVGEPTFWTSM